MISAMYFWSQLPLLHQILGFHILITAGGYASNDIGFSLSENTGLVSWSYWNFPTGVIKEKGCSIFCHPKADLVWTWIALSSYLHQSTSLMFWFHHLNIKVTWLAKYCLVIISNEMRLRPVCVPVWAKQW